MAKPWWVNAKGGKEAAAKITQMNLTPGLQSAWLVANRTRLSRSPELGAAVMRSGMDFATARHLDVADQAMRAQKQRDLIQKGGLSQQMVPGTLAAPAAAADKPKKEDEGGGVFSAIGDLFQGAWNVGKGIFDGVMEGLNFISSPLHAPLRAGMAQEDTALERGLKSGLATTDQQSKANEILSKHGLLPAVNPLGVAGAAAEGAIDWAKGAGTLIAGGVPGSQRADMGRAGLDPTSFIDRWRWYMDQESSPGRVVIEDAVADLKQKYSPEKVDLARQVITSGVLEDIGRVSGLSREAQTFLHGIQANGDKEGGTILSTLASASAATMGAELADYMGLERGTTKRTAVEVVGDLAAYWYLDPLVLGSKGFRALKYNRYGVHFDPDEVKAALVENTHVARRWDDILDRVDKIHVMDQAGDAVGAATEFSKFQTLHKDVMPLYDLLSGMRSGAVKGTLFRAPEGKIKDLADLDVIGLDRVDDAAARTPLFSLRSNVADEVTDETRTAARAAIADQIGDAILAHAIADGRPIIGGKLLMPGQINVTSRVKTALTPFVDKVLGQKGSLFKQLEEAKGKGLIDFTKADTESAAHVLASRQGGEWIHENYTKGGLRARMSMTLSRMGTFSDKAILKFDGESTKTFHDFVRFFMPRGQSAFLAQQWAKADPAARKALWENTVDALGNARGIGRSPAAQDFWRQQLKGKEANLKHGDAVNEAYSTPASDLIDTPSGKLAAAMYSTQMADGVALPSIIDIVKNTQKVGLMSMLTGLSHSRLVDTATRTLKVGQVATTSNMLRQALESRVWQAMETPSSALRATGARLGVAGSRATERANINEAVRQARSIVRSDEIDELVELNALGKRKEYLDRIEGIVTAAGAKRTGTLNRLLEAGVDVEEIAKLRGATRLTLTWPVDLVRRLRGTTYAPAAKHFSAEPEAWVDEATRHAVESYAEGAMRSIGGAREAYAHGSGLADDLDYIQDGLKAGHRLSAVRLKNTMGHLGTAGDTGAIRWADALGARLNDPVGAPVAQSIAQSFLDDVAGIARTGDDPSELAFRLLKDFPEGEKYRLYGMRAKYLNGKAVTTPEQAEEALKVWADEIVDDMSYYLGASRGDNGEFVFRREAEDLLTRVAAGEKDLGHNVLGKIPDEFRPETVQARTVVGRKFLELEGQGLLDAIGDVASKAYKFTVSGPLQRLAHDPQMIGAHHEAMVAMTPWANALKAKGLSDQTVYQLLEANAWQHAANRVLRYSDNPRVASYFAALSNNFLWYERATEDFVRRFMRVTKADPATLSRAHTLLEAGQHSGIIYRQKTKNEEGEAEDELMFVYPGSGMLTRAVSEGLVGLGLVDADVVKVPVWQDFASPVKYLNASLQNPLGFTTSPLVGLPLRLLRSAFPEHGLAIDKTLTALEGGERSFGSQGIWESLLPVNVRRLINSLSEDSRDSQFASAMRNNLVYLSAAGKIPGPDADPAVRQQALDDLRIMTINTVYLRTILAAFTPATPGMAGMDVSDIGEQNEFDKLRGINSVRGEWFQLLEDMTRAHGDRGFAEAQVEWLRRGHGSIINPEAFWVGSTKGPGEDNLQAGTVSNLPTTQWMLDNRDFLKEYGEVAYKLLPDLGQEYYNQIGYRAQLRDELRRHKDLHEFYGDLVYAQASQDWFIAFQKRQDALEGATSQAEKNRIYNEWNRFEDDLVRSNPLWDKMRTERNLPERVHADVAPAVRRLAEVQDLPEEIKPLQKDLQLMAKLYGDYRSAFDKVNGRTSSAFSTRKAINEQYRNKGSQLFKSTPLADLWSIMDVYEDE